MKIIILVFFILSLLSSCRKDRIIPESVTNSTQGVRTVNLYAENFTSTDYGSYREVIVSAGSGTVYRYCLYRSEKPDIAPDPGAPYQFIKIPVKRIVSLSSENIFFLDALDSLGLLKGIDSKKNTSNSKIPKLAGSGEIIQIGEGREIDTEKLYFIKPDVVFTPWTGADNDSAVILAEKGFPAAVTAGWLEKHPLGRAEWIVFISLFLDIEKEGREIFSITERNYNSLKLLISDESTSLKDSSLPALDAGAARPSVFSNMIYGDSWGLPGGKSYAAIMMEDAGAYYPWSNTKGTGSLFLDFETVFEAAGEADVWLVNSAGIKSSDDILRKDRRYSLFKAFRRGRVYNNDWKEKGDGNPYWDEGTVYPDRILSDLIKIFHPESAAAGAAGVDFNYYRLLE